MGKKVLFIFLALLFCCGAVACSNQTAAPEETSKATTEETVTQETEESESVVEAEYDPFGAYEETITLTYGKPINPAEKLAEGETHEENQYTRNILKELNIKAETYWQVAQGNDSDQRINLAIASDDLPDALVVNSSQLYQMVRAGQVADMTEIYNNYASEQIKYMMETSNGIAEKMVNFDGKMMAIPSLNVPDDGYHLMWLRKDWLDKLGLEVPKTMDELEAVAKAFVEQDPDGNGLDDTIGILGPQNGGKLYADFLQPTNNSFGLDPIFAASKSFPGFWLPDENGNAVYGSILPETKEALAKIADLFARGLIDPELGIRDDSSQAAVSQEAGIMFGLWWFGYWPLPSAWEIEPNANWQAYPVYADDGKAYFHMGTPCNTFIVVNKNYEHPEAIMKIANVNFRDTSIFDLNLSGSANEVLRCPMGPYDELKMEKEIITDYLNGEVQMEDYDEDFYRLYKLLENDMSTIKLVKAEPYNDLGIEFWTPEGDDNFARMYSIMVGGFPIYDESVTKEIVFSLTYSQTKSMASKWSNLRKLEDEAFLKIIFGEAPIDSFDEFVEQWKKQGGDEITAEVQEVSLK